MAASSLSSSSLRLSEQRTSFDQYTKNNHDGYTPLGTTNYKNKKCGPVRTASFRMSAHGLEYVDKGGLGDDADCAFALAFGDGKLSLSQVNSDDEKTSENDTNFATSPLVGSHCNTRAGLFRTPIPGGVQNATSAHGLPKPALAVRNLMEQARFGHLCTVMSKMHRRQKGYPFGSLVEFATDAMGHPIFSFSPLVMHARNLLADPRCSLVVQTPGWCGLSNARATIFGDVYPLHKDEQEWAHKQHVAKHQHRPSQQWENFSYFRMQNLSDIYFIGGFGTVAWIDVKEYETLQPDKISVDSGEQSLKELNSIFSKPLKELLSRESEVDDVALISIDSRGVDIRLRDGAQFNVQRISFKEGCSVETLDQAKNTLWKLIKNGQYANVKHDFAEALQNF